MDGATETVMTPLARERGVRRAAEHDEPGRDVKALGPANVGPIMAATVLGQGLALLAFPLLTRLFSPAEFGVYSIVNALAMVLGTVAASRFELAVPLPKGEATAYRLVAVGLASSALTACIGFTTIAVLRAADLLNSAQPGLVSNLWWVPPIAAVVGGYTILNHLAIRQGRFRAIAARNVIQAVVMVATQVGSGLLGLRAGGLVLGLLLGQLVGAVSLLVGSRAHAGFVQSEHRLVDLWQTIKRYRRFPLLLSPAGLCNSLGIYAPVVLVGMFFGTASAGLFGLTQRVLALPIMLIGQAVAQVYLSHIAGARRTGSGHELELFNSTTWRLLGIGVLGAALLGVAAPRLFVVAFGDAFAASGDIARLLAVAMAAQIVASPLSHTLVAYERIYAQLAWDLARLTAISAGIALPAVAGASLEQCVGWYAAASTAAYACSWWLCRRTIVRGRAGRTSGLFLHPHDQS